MKLAIVTVVKDDLIGLIKTRDSILSQSSSVIWKIVTPFDHTETHFHAIELLERRVATLVLEDTGRGVYSAMNGAIHSSSPHEWLWFLNAGDELAGINSYQTVQTRISSCTSRWAYGGHYLGSQSGKILGEIAAPKDFKISNQLFAKKYVSHQATIFQNSLLQELRGFDRTFAIAADWDLMVRASKIEPPMRLNEPLCVFYMGGLSTRARQISNVELLQLRKSHLPVNYFFKSYIWFLYRFLRNKIVQSFEKIFPESLNFARKLRLRWKIKRIWLDEIRRR